MIKVHIYKDDSPITYDVNATREEFVKRLESLAGIANVYADPDGMLHVHTQNMTFSIEEVDNA